MSTKKNKIIFTALVACITLVSVSYFSCQKTGKALACDGVACQNGGYCLKGQCLCPTGYEDSACSTPIVSKYLGFWKVNQTIITSDSAKQNGRDSTFSVAFEKTPNESSFYIYNFLNNNEYNKVVCTISSTNSYNFDIDTTTNAAMRFANIHFWGGKGTISLNYFPWGARHPALDTIVCGFFYKFINPLNNWQVDTMKWVLTRQE